MYARARAHRVTLCVCVRACARARVCVWKRKRKGEEGEVKITTLVAPVTNAANSYASICAVSGIEHVYQKLTPYNVLVNSCLPFTIHKQQQAQNTTNFTWQCLSISVNFHFTILIVESGMSSEYVTIFHTRQTVCCKPKKSYVSNKTFKWTVHYYNHVKRVDI